MTKDTRGFLFGGLLVYFGTELGPYFVCCIILIESYGGEYRGKQ